MSTDKDTDQVTDQVTDQNLKTLLDKPIATLLSEVFRTGSLKRMEKFWSVLLNGTLNDLLNEYFKCSNKHWSDKDAQDMIKSEVFATATLKKLLCSLSKISAQIDQKPAAMVKSRGKKLYVGKGLTPGATVKFYLPTGYYISFTKNLNRYHKDGSTPLRLVGRGNHQKILIGDKIEPQSASPGLVECVIDKEYTNKHPSQPDFFYFAIRKIGDDGNANDPNDASDLRVAVLNNGDVKGVEFYLYSSPDNWFQRVTLKAKKESPLLLLREADIFNSLRELINSFNDLSNLDIVDVQHSDSITHFDNGPSRITFDTGSKRQCVARLNWPKHETA